MFWANMRKMECHLKPILSTTLFLNYWWQKSHCHLIDPGSLNPDLEAGFLNCLLHLCCRHVTRQRRL